MKNRMHKTVPASTMILAAMLFGFSGTASAAPAAEPPSAAPAAEAYLAWTRSALAQAETNLPAITAAAQIAAEAFMAGRDLGVRGGAGLNEELGARSGGLCVYRATKGNPGDVVLYAFGVATDKDADVAALLERELADAEALKAAGSTVIGLASFRQLDVQGKMARAKAVCAASALSSASCARPCQ